MAGRIRTIKPELLEDEKAAALSDSAWRLFVSSWLLCDDHGRFRAVESQPLSELAAAGIVEIVEGGAKIVDPRKWFGIASPEYWSKAAYPEVIARDGMCCRYCGAAVTEDTIHVDHVLPRCQGGGDEATNLVVACRSCNQRKGGRTPAQAGMVLR